MPEIEVPEQETDLGETLNWITGVFLRRRWWIIISACCITLATIGALWLIPNRYTSEATLLVVAQQVPLRYVVPNSTADLNSTLQAMKQEVLSRTRLLRMINDFGLYPKQRSRLAPEQLVSLMLADIDILPIGEHPQEKNFDAFRISYTAENALLAQQVTSTLTSLFINEHLRTQEEQSTNTTKFLHDQVVGKKAQLDQQEQRLRDFKMQHIGELPEQQQGNLGILTGLQAQLQNTTISLNRAHQQQVYLQSLIDAQQRQTTAKTVIPSAPGGAIVSRVLSPVDIAQNELTRLESQKAAMLPGKTPAHPDVIKIQREIDQAQNHLKQLRSTATASVERDRPSVSAPSPSSALPAYTPPMESADDPILAQLKGQLEVNKLEIDNLSRDERRLKTTIAQYENRLNQTPVREQQQTGIVRETEALRLEYADLQKKEQESQLATNLEKQQGGMQFRLVDPASLPLIPTSPKRLKQSLMGIAAGIFVGLALAFVMEMQNNSFRSEKELIKQIDAPFVVGIPLIQTPHEERRLKWTRVLECLAGSAMLFIVLIAEYFVYKHG